MALHTALPIFTAAYSLLDRATTSIKDMPRDYMADAASGELAQVEREVDALHTAICIAVGMMNMGWDDFVSQLPAALAKAITDGVRQP